MYTVLPSYVNMIVVCSNTGHHITIYMSIYF